MIYLAELKLYAVVCLFYVRKWNCECKNILTIYADQNPASVLIIRPSSFYFSSHLSKSVSIIIYEEIAGGVNSTMENSFLQPTISCGVPYAKRFRFP